MTSEARGLAELIVVAVICGALPAAYLVARRRELRRRHLFVPLVVLLGIIPVVLPMVHDLRTKAGGEAGAWGRLGELIIVLSLAPIACAAAGALLTLLVLLPRYGFADEETLAAITREPWHQRLRRPRTHEETMQRLKISLVAIVVAGVLYLLGLRPGR